MKAQEYVVNGEVVGDNFDTFLEEFEFAGEGYKCVGVTTKSTEYFATMQRLNGTTFTHQFYPEVIYSPSIDKLMDEDGIDWK